MSGNGPTTNSPGGHEAPRAVHASSTTDDLSGPFTDPELTPLLAALNAAPADRELDGLGPTLTAFRAHVSSPPNRTRWRRSMLSSLAGAKLGATIAAAAVTVGGAATVAYVQTANDTAPETHVTGSPTAIPSASPTQKDAAGAKGMSTEHGTPVGPDATGSAAYGLCTAWKGVAMADGKAMDSVAFKNLVDAAGGEDKVADFCAAVPAPGKSTDHATGMPTDHPTGKPDSVPTTKAVTPTARPTATPSGRPDTAPVEPPATHP
jgi:hypothetical protein